MDPRTVEINNLRVLNDFLNQTLSALCRVQGTNVVGGVNMNAATGAPFGATLGVPSYMLAHTPALAMGLAFGTPFASPMMTQDPFFAQRFLSHSVGTVGSSLSTFGPLAEIARRLENLEAQRVLGVPF